MRTRSKSECETRNAKRETSSGPSGEFDYSLRRGRSQRHYSPLRIYPDASRKDARIAHKKVLAFPDAKVEIYYTFIVRFVGHHVAALWMGRCKIEVTAVVENSIQTLKSLFEVIIQRNDERRVGRKDDAFSPGGSGDSNQCRKCLFDSAYVSLRLAPLDCSPEQQVSIASH